ncbi:MAG: acyltransferase [Verrucomicrobiae bacterium]|nr:acyltransferase [Verrucomicrobiae bacterium]
MQDGVESQRQYQPQFNTLRFIAVFLVLVDHICYRIPNFPLPDFFQLGATGVRFFLVLSGYFITLSLLKIRRKIDSGEMGLGAGFRLFYGRRAVRIFPAFFCLFGLGIILGFESFTKYWVWILTFTVNFLIATQDYWPGQISHLWSICVQEQFYLIWPLLIFLFRGRLLLALTLGFILGAIVYRATMIIIEAPLAWRWVFPLNCFDSLGCGALVALYKVPLTQWIKAWSRWKNCVAFLLCLAALTAAAFLRKGDQYSLWIIWVEPLESIALSLLVIKTAVGFTGVVGIALGSSFLNYLGSISYGTYIYHFMVINACDRWMPLSLRWLIEWPWARLITCVLLSITVAIVSWRFLEQPIYRFFFKE